MFATYVKEKAEQSDPLMPLLLQRESERTCEKHDRDAREVIRNANRPRHIKWRSHGGSSVRKDSSHHWIAELCSVLCAANAQ